MSDSQLEAEFEHWLYVLAPALAECVEREQILVPGRKFKCDFCFRMARIVVEIDGGQYAPGGGRHNTDKDREKLNLLALHGWSVFRYSGSMLKRDPQAIIEQVRKAMSLTAVRGEL